MFSGEMNLPFNTKKASKHMIIINVFCFLSDQLMPHCLRSVYTAINLP